MRFVNLENNIKQYQDFSNIEYRAEGRKRDLEK